MPLVVPLSQGVLANLLALQQTTTLINTVQTQLATGKKVNSALDNPTNFFLANSFQTSVNTLNTLLDNINIGQRTLDAANNGITSLTNLLNSAKGTLNQALASASTTSVLTGTATGLASTTLLSSLGFAATDVITVNDGTTNTTTFTAAANTTVQGLLNFINQGGSTADIQNLGFNATATNGTINNTAAAGSLNSSRSAFAAQFDALRTQIDQQAADSGYNGTSLLNSQSLSVTLNQTGTAKLILTGNSDTSAGLGVVASANSFQDNFDINAALTNVNNALTSLQNQASTAASQVSVIQSRKDFTSNSIATLQNGINDLTLADSNQVGAQLLALQTRQTLASTALSLATQ